jgi:hypothetical protein
MKRIVTIVLCALLSGCKTGNADYGAALALVGYGLMWSGISRASGGCFALCTGLDVCNAESGLCEPAACGLGCGPGRHCDLHSPAPVCVQDEMPADLVQQPPPPDPLPDFIVPPK